MNKLAEVSTAEYSLRTEGYASTGTERSHAKVFLRLPSGQESVTSILYGELSEQLPGFLSSNFNDEKTRSDLYAKAESAIGVHGRFVKNCTPRSGRGLCKDGSEWSRFPIPREWETRRKGKYGCRGVEGH